ncbi:hsp20/alpha crystallin family protein [Medicago truncatula]|uniref:Hsp20/alpha crystallin family protein n=1 Tax=Medicago truncatula TaxID=3880 RepID=G7J9N1_MEDTR|nr:hsp20/alpha crystallin family protein [Medicago truncatula]
MYAEYGICGGRVFLLNSNTSTINSRKKATNLLASCYQVSLIHSLKFLCSKTTNNLSSSCKLYFFTSNISSSPTSNPYLFNLYANGFPLPLIPSPPKVSCCSRGLFHCLPLCQEQHLRHRVLFPWQMLYRVFQTKERLFFQQLFQHIDMRVTEDNLLLRLHLLQLDREDVKIYVDHKTITIKDAHGGSIFGIFGDGSRFTYTLELTEQYCKHPITAKMENSMLEVVVPKMNNEEDMLNVVLQGVTIDVKVE